MPIDTRLSYDDLMWIIAAADAWEEKESHEFYMAKEILSIPEFDEEHPAFEFIQALKRKYRGQEQNLADKRDDVSEQAATMKAKLYYLKKQLGMAGLLDVEEGAIIKESGETQALPKKPFDKMPKKPFVDMPEKPHPLQAKLDQAIRLEDYDLAAKIRDEIKESED